MWFVNDGLVPAGGITGNDVFVITSSDGKSFSPEFRIAFGEVRIIDDIYEIRFRCPAAGNYVRASEREIIPPYIQSIVVSGGSVATTANRPTFVSHTILNVQDVTVAPFGEQLSAVPVPIPDGFSIVVRASVNNIDGSAIYVADSLLNVQTPVNRIALSPGDSVKLYITDASNIWVAGSDANEDVEWIVEQ
jgi:hypothetical protein